MSALEASDRRARLRFQFAIRNSQFSILLILLLALALRVLLWAQPLHQLANDEIEYVAVARDLLAGRGWQFYEHYHWLRAPLYPLFLAGSLWLAGGDPSPGLPTIGLGTARALHLAALPNIALSATTVYLIYRLTLALFGPGRRGRAPLLAALLAALLWTLVTFAGLYMAETLFTFLLMSGLLCLVSWRVGSGGRRALWLAIGAGALFGLATLTRSITLLFLPVLALWMLLYRPRTKDEGPTIARMALGDSWRRWSLVAGRWSAAACFLLSAALVVAPWTIRNYRAYGRVILVETGLSYNLWAFNEPRESEGEIFHVLESIPNPAERSDYATAKGLARLREDPAILARKLWPNWIYLWRVKPIEDRFLQESYYADIGLPLFSAALLFDDLLYLLIALAGVAGLVLNREQRKEGRPARGVIQRLLVTWQQPKWLLIGWLVYAVATMLLTHGEARYRQFLFPVLIPYAAWMLVRWAESRQTRRQGDKEMGRAASHLSPLNLTPNTQQLRPDSGHPTPDTYAPSPIPRYLAIVVLWLLIGGVWVAFYPREWTSQNILRGWHALSSEIAWAGGWHDAALRADARAIAAQETPDGWLRLGEHARTMGDTRRARRAYREAVALTPPYVAAVARLGDLLRAQGDQEAAKAFVGDYVDQQQLVEWSWRVLRPVPRSYLNVGDGLDFGYVGGVYSAEKQDGVLARWSDGRATVRLPGSGPGVLRLRLAAPRPDGRATRVEVCAAGRCQELAVGPTWRTYELPLAKRLAESDQIDLTSETFLAGEGRRLGILIDWVDAR